MADPINLPPIPWGTCRLDPISPVDINMMEKRRTEMAASMTPYWVASYSAEVALPQNSGLFDAFIMKADARGAPFLAFDPARPRPIAMDTKSPLSGNKAGGGAFTGQAVLQTVVNSRQVVISGLPAGFKLLPGDYIEFRMTALKRSLHRIVEPATATNFGVVTLYIMFGLDTQNFNTNAVVNFERPSTVMTIDPGSVQAPKASSGRDASFSATEVFYS
ncbi:UNVERIFIED_ORG: hypothetical protein J2W19_003126 [Shinella zoogloeoides]|nr:hypothetical protein [Shinella zoogloeoides]